MKIRFSVLAIISALLLSGCLAHMRATNIADSRNAQAKNEGSPYRWVVTDLEGDNAKLEQQLAGDVGQSKITDMMKEKILLNICQLETQNGRITKPKLKEVRIVTESWYTADLWDTLKNRMFETWVFDNSGKEVVYSIQYIPEAKDDEFLVKGPWAKHP